MHDQYVFPTNVKSWNDESTSCKVTYDVKKDTKGTSLSSWEKTYFNVYTSVPTLTPEKWESILVIEKGSGVFLPIADTYTFYHTAQITANPNTVDIAYKEVKVTYKAFKDTANPKVYFDTLALNMFNTILQQGFPFTSTNIEWYLQQTKNLGGGSLATDIVGQISTPLSQMLSGGLGFYIITEIQVQSTQVNNFVDVWI